MAGTITKIKHLYATLSCLDSTGDDIDIEPGGATDILFFQYVIQVVDLVTVDLQLCS